MERAKFIIEGMSCEHCIARVRAALEKVPGTSVDKVEVGSAEVSFDPVNTDRRALVVSLENAGYHARVDPSLPSDKADLAGVA